MTIPVIQVPGQPYEHARQLAMRGQFEVECFDELPKELRVALREKAQCLAPSWALRMLEAGVTTEILLEYLKGKPDGPKSSRPSARGPRRPR